MSRSKWAVAEQALDKYTSWIASRSRGTFGSAWLEAMADERLDGLWLRTCSREDRLMEARRVCTGPDGPSSTQRYWQLGIALAAAIRQNDQVAREIRRRGRMPKGLL